MPTPRPTTPNIPLATLAALPRFYSARDVLDTCFGGDEDAFYTAWCDGSLPLAVRQTCEETLDPVRLQNALLRQIVRVLLVPTVPTGSAP